MKNNYRSMFSFPRLLLLLVLLSLPAVGFGQGLSPDDQAKLQAVLERIVNNPDQPFIGGISAAIKIEDLAMWKGTAGHAARNIDAYRTPLPGGTPYTVETPSHIYSVTKTFTAALVIELAQEGILDLDAPASKYIPLRMVNSQLNDQVTLRQLMSHHTGYSDYVWDRNFQIAVAYSPSRVWKAHEAIAYAKQLVEPGTAYNYSSTNYVILGNIVEATTGKPLEVHYRERFLKPLNLGATYLSAREPHGTRSTLAAPHDNLSPFNPIFHMLGRPLYPNTYTNISSFPLTAIMSSVHAGGAMVSTVEDMVSWGDALFSGKATSAATLQIMLNSIPTGEATGDEVYGYGLIKNNRISDRDVFIGHGGRATGYRALMVHQPEKKITIAIASNFAAADVYAIAKAIYDALPAYYCGENGGKIQLCFNGQSICVAKEAIPALFKQKAFLGSCSVAPANASSREASPATAVATSRLTAYPNPFQETVTFSFSEAIAGPASLNVYDMQGKVVATLFNRHTEAGVVHQVTLSQKSLPGTGIYVGKLTTASGVKTQRIIFTR